MLELSSTHFAKIYGDEFHIAQVRRSKLIQKLKQIARLPTVDACLEVYPDVLEKEWGFPAGIWFSAKGDTPFVYPLAVPDYGDAYSLCTLNIHADDLSQGEWRRYLEAILAELSVDSRQRQHIKVVNIEAAMNEGLSYIDSVLPSLDIDLADPFVENYPWQWSVDDLPAHIYKDLGRALGSTYGHFIECKIIQEVYNEKLANDNNLKLNQVVLIIHLGAGPLREYLHTFSEKMIHYDIENLVIPNDLLLEGMFGVPIQSGVGQEYLRTAMATMKFGLINRHVVRYRLLSILISLYPHLRNSIQSVMFSHKVHAVMDYSDVSVPSIGYRRGLQYLSHATENIAGSAFNQLTLVSGGKYTHSYLVAPGSQSKNLRNLISHGVPTWKRPEDSNSSERNIHSMYRMPQVIANMPFEKARYEYDYANLEAEIEYFRVNSIAQPIALLKPLLNFEDTIQKWRGPEVNNDQSDLYSFY